MTPTPLHFEPHIRLFAAGLEGDHQALVNLANAPDLGDLVALNRIGPGLAIRAAEQGITGPQVSIWNEHMRIAAAGRMRLAAAMARLSEALAEAEIPWAPFKGMGLDPRIYTRPEERISTDLDVLISPEHLEPAIDTLEDHGFRSLYPSARHRHFLETEGYNWKAVYGEDLLLELHYRLWGGVPEGLGHAIFSRAVPAPDLGSTAGRIELADAYLIAAVHIWQTPPPRYLTLWWDLHLLAEAMDDNAILELIARTTEHGLQAFVAHAAEAAAALWDQPNNHLIQDRLNPLLRPPERWASTVPRQSSPTQASLKVITFGRLFSARPSRSGWRAAARQIWAHPAIVEQDTPEDWSWPRRRLKHVARKLGIAKE